MTLNPVDWVNWPLLREPLNWAIVGTIASIWLMAFHVVMTGFGAMQGSGTGQAIGGGGPGTIAAPQAGGTVSMMFGTPGSTGGVILRDSATSWFGSDNMWTDGFEAKFAEDGWTGNP